MTADHLLPFLAGFVYPAIIALLLLATALRFKRPALFYRTILGHLRAKPIMSEAERQAISQAAHRSQPAVQHMPAAGIFGVYHR
jgi:hypothetical protein